MAGSLLKRNDVWYLRYELPRRSDGRRRQKMVACPSLNKRQAEEKLRRILSEIHIGTYIDPSSTSLQEYFEKWMGYTQANLAPSTAHGYKRCIDCYILPAIGDYCLDKLQPLQLQDLLSTLLKSGRVDRTGGLSAKTVYNIHGILHVALRQAVRWRLLAVNPMDAVEPPKLRRREMHVASSRDIAALLGAVGKSDYRIPIMIALATGMRRGEVLGLKWEDLGIEKCTLNVRRSITQIPGCKPAPKEPKTGRARIVAIPLSIVKLLQAHQAEQLRSAHANDQDWICTHPDGSPITPNAMTKSFMRIRDKLGIKISFHGLRHTQATELILAGVPVRVVSERLGHANTTITQDVYGHVLPHAQREAADVIERMLSVANETAGES